MQEDRDSRLEVEAILERYSNLNSYEKTDAWHEFTSARIRDELQRRWSKLQTSPRDVILNAGAGNNDLGICSASALNLDLSDAGVSRLPNPIVASIEDIPLPDESVGAIICVGSVINYCDAAAAISEFGRVLRAGGFLALEYESSRGADLILQRAFGRSAAIAETFYANEPEALWVFHPHYIRSLLTSVHLVIEETIPIHIASPWAYLLTRNVKVASVMARLDRLLRFAPFLARWASNHLLFCRKGPSLPTKNA
jgi:SAM-dependent methyltransferase